MSEILSNFSLTLSVDVASSEFYKTDAKKYDLDFKNPDSDQSKWLTYEQLADLYKSLAEKYPIVSIEDPFAEDDWEAWSYFYKTSDFQIVGDDLTVTNPAFIKKAIELKSCNALLLKVNQIGTITEAIQAAKDAFGAGWGVMVSHRSGETEDVTIGNCSPYLLMLMEYVLTFRSRYRSRSPRRTNQDRRSGSFRASC